MRLLLTGAFIDAAEALRVGLVSEMTAPEDLQSTARGIADQIAANGPAAHPDDEGTGPARPRDVTARRPCVSTRSTRGPPSPPPTPRKACAPSPNAETPTTAAKSLSE